MTRYAHTLTIFSWALLASCQSSPIEPEPLMANFGSLAARGSSATVGVAANLGNLGGPKSWAHAISDAGDVVGGAWLPDCLAAAFCWATSTGMIELPRLPGSVAAARGTGEGIHANTVVGIGMLSDEPKMHPAARWTRGADGRWTAHELGTLAGDDHARAYGISGDLTVSADAEIVVGQSALVVRTRAFVWTTAEPIQQLPVPPEIENSTARSVNQYRSIAGYASDASKIGQAVVWTWTGAEWTMSYLPKLAGYTTHIALKINNHGVIVGYTKSADGRTGRAVRWIPGASGYQIRDDIGSLGGPESEAWGLNDRGQIVGRSKIGKSSTWRGFVWEAGKGIRELGALSGYAESAAYAINNAQPAAVVGTSYASNGNSQAVRWLVPQ